MKWVGGASKEKINKKEAIFIRSRQNHLPVLCTIFTEFEDKITHSDLKQIAN